MPTLSPGTRKDHLKYDDDEWRIWLYCDGTVIVDRKAVLDLGRGGERESWVRADQYKG